MRIDETKWTKAQVRPLAALTGTAPNPGATDLLNSSAATACGSDTGGRPEARSANWKKCSRLPTPRLRIREELSLRPLKAKKSVLGRPAGTRH